MEKIKSPSKKLKRQFRAAKLGNCKLSLKTYARKLAEEGDDIAKAWLFNKSLQVNKEAKEDRLINKGTMIALKRAASKLARQRRSLKKQGGSKSVDDSVG